VKTQIRQLLDQALLALDVPLDNTAIPLASISVDFTKDRKHGDFATNIAMVLAKPLKQSPRALAEQIVSNLPEHSAIEKVDIAGPGFINFFLTQQAFAEVIDQILVGGQAYGHSDVGQNKKVHIEFVSANPTGPLHVGHGRGAAFGAVCANLLKTIGFDVHKEYYVNDAGRQMHILALSVWLRYLEQLGESFVFPSNAYRGDYIKAIASDLYQSHQKRFYHPIGPLMAEVTPDKEGGGNEDAHVDDLIAQAKAQLGEDYVIIFKSAIQSILTDIQEDLQAFGVDFDQWFSEESLVQSQAFERAVEALQAQGVLYEQAGALWFAASRFGDDKDRVLVKANGDRTYFANDVAYHVDKYHREFDRVIDIMGADHHGYIPRIKAVLTALGHSVDDFAALLVQFAILYRGSERIAMSTRSGSFVTLRELREEVGNDAARFFYIMRKHDQHLDFDLSLAVAKTQDNPVFYIQYAHARICSVFAQLSEKGLTHDPVEGGRHYHLLTAPQEEKLIACLARYRTMLVEAALHHEPHLLAAYLHELAKHFHAYYNAYKFLSEEVALTQARVNLILAVKQVIYNGLNIIGVSAPKEM